MTPWSVMATAGMSSSATRLTMSFTCVAPSSREYSVWLCKCTNAIMCLWSACALLRNVVPPSGGNAGPRLSASHLPARRNCLVRPLMIPACTKTDTEQSMGIRRFWQCGCRRDQQTRKPTLPWRSVFRKARSQPSHRQRVTASLASSTSRPPFPAMRQAKPRLWTQIENEKHYVRRFALLSTLQTMFPQVAIAPRRVRQSNLPVFRPLVLLTFRMRPQPPVFQALRSAVACLRLHLTATANHVAR